MAGSIEPKRLPSDDGGDDDGQSPNDDDDVSDVSVVAVVVVVVTQPSSLSPQAQGLGMRAEGLWGSGRRA